jgi:NAD(P)H-dependent flavin oxidoreductase YrpB (nitropropane dioxygenase family)
MPKPTLKTALCDLLEIEYPVLLAGMGMYAMPGLVAAVSNAGGLGARTAPPRGRPAAHVTRQ